MVRTYKNVLGSRNYKNHTDEQLQETLEKFTDGRLSIRVAVFEYKIPFGTLHNKFHGQPIFFSTEESALINAAVKCADWGFPLTLLDLRMLGKAYLDKCGRAVTKFKNNIPGKDWALSLLKRHKTEVAQRLASNINKSRAAVSKETLEIYFANLQQTLEGVTPKNTFNYDETNVGDDPGKARAIYRRGTKYPEKVLNHSKSNTTIMICGSADGTLLPPYVIYNTWKEGGIKGCQGDKPCCVTEADLIGLETSFLPHARRLEGRKVLIGDNLASHFSESIIRLCEENNISFVCLVLNSTHICQPLDVTFFKLMKVAWRSILTDYKLKNRASGIQKETFPSLLKHALQKMDQATPQTSIKPGDQEKSAIKRNLINGFYASGIHPFNPRKVLDKIPGTSENDNNPGSIFEDALSELLRANRFGGQNSQRIQRKRKRINTEPGKSVATVDSSSSDEPLDMSESDNTSVDYLAIEEVEYTHPDSQILLPECFVLVHFLGGKRRSMQYKYVCKIQSQFSETEYTVVGYKSTNQEKTVFKLMPKDISTVPLSDISAILSRPANVDGTTEIKFEKKVDMQELSK